MKTETKKTDFFKAKLSDKTLNCVNECLVNDCLKLKPKKKLIDTEKYFKHDNKIIK